MWHCSGEPDSRSERIVMSGLAICPPPNVRLETLRRTSCPPKYHLQDSVSGDIFHPVVPRLGFKFSALWPHVQYIVRHIAVTYC